MTLSRLPAEDEIDEPRPSLLPGFAAGGRSPMRVAIAYALLVVLPALAIVLFLGVLAAPRARGVATPHHDAGVDTFPPLLLAVVVILTACALAGAAFRRIGQPPVVGEIVTGVVLGPSVLGALWPGATRALFPAAIMPQLNALAQLGVILFVFVAGLELNTRLLRGRGDVALVVSHVSIAVPFLLGVVLALGAYRTFAPAGVEFVPFALFLGVALSITALPVMARILMDTRMYHSEVGTVALTCALVGDVTAWCLLAVVVALTRSGSTAGVLLIFTLTAAFVLVMMLVVRPLLNRLATAAAPGQQQAGWLLPVMLVALLLSALSTDRIGVHSIFGAFVFGLACPSEAPVFRQVRQKVGGLTTALLLPLFFTFSGLRTDIGLLGTEGGRWLWCLLVLVVAIVGKLVATAVGARAVGVSWAKSAQLGALMNARGLTELIVLNVGLDLGVLDRSLFTILVIMAVISTAMTSPILLRLQRRIEGQLVDSAGQPEAAPGTAWPAPDRGPDSQ